MCVFENTHALAAQYPLYRILAQFCGEVPKRSHRARLEIELWLNKLYVGSNPTLSARCRGRACPCPTGRPQGSPVHLINDHFRVKRNAVCGVSGGCHQFWADILRTIKNLIEATVRLSWIGEDYETHNVQIGVSFDDSNRFMRRLVGWYSRDMDYNEE